MTNVKLYILLIMIFLCSPMWVLANTTNHVVISEVQIEGDTTTDEFIELYNPTSVDINLTNWRLAKKTSSGNQTNILTAFPNSTIKPGGYFLIAHADYKGSSTADVFYSLSSASLAKDNTVLLYSDAGKTLVDKLGFGTSQDKESNAAPNPEKKESLERKLNVDTDNNFADFFIQTIPNPKNTNSTITTNTSILNNTSGQSISNPTTTPANQPQTTIPAQPQPYLITTTEPKPGEVVINEFLPNTIDSQKEWIELYNTTNHRISLGNHFLEEYSGKKIELYDFLEAEGVNKFLVVEIDSGYLNNDGDLIILKNKNGIIIDKVAYGDFKDNNINDNAEAPPKDISIARSNDGLNTNNNARDFKLTFAKTKGMPNIIYTGKDQTTNDQKNPRQSVFYGKIIINEVLPNPFGNDKNNEFIELKNLTHEEIDLNLWQVTNNTGKYIINKKDFSDTKIKPQGFFVLPANLTQLVLANNSDQIKLLEETSAVPMLVDSLNYEKHAKNNLSYNKIGEHNLAWTISTPGKENILTILNEAPKAVINNIPKGVVGEEIIFDASLSFDPEDDDLEYFWNFGDGNTSQYRKISHAYKEPGNYKVALTVLDMTGASDTKKFMVKIIESQIAPTKKEELRQYVAPLNSPSSVDKISENDKLTKISGPVIRTRGRIAYINVNGSEIRAYFQENIFPNYPKLYKGDLVTIVGIKDKIKNGYRVLPQKNSDIEINRVEASGVKDKQDDVLYNNILGEEIKLSEENHNPKNGDNINYKYYFYITLVALIAVVGYTAYSKYVYKKLT